MEIVQKTLDVKGFKIAYTDTGPEDGRVLFCVHGLLSNGRDYDALAQHMAAEGFRVIAMDLPGRGRSDWFADAAQYVLPSYLPYCLALAKHVTGGKGFDWLGVSLGGMIGMALQGMTRIERLILVDIGAEIPAAALDVVSEFARSPVTYATQAEAEQFLRVRCASWGITQQATWNHLFAQNIVKERDSYRLHYDPKIGEALPMKNVTVSFWPLWGKVRKPVLLIRGGLSALLPEGVAAQMIAGYRGVNMREIVFQECGHVPNLMEDTHLEALAAYLAQDIRPPKKKGIIARISALIKGGPFQLKYLPAVVMLVLGCHLVAGLNLWLDIALCAAGGIFAFWMVAHFQYILAEYARNPQGRTPYWQLALIIWFLLALIQLPIIALVCMVPFFPFVK
jgi:pimeloyl-ACP methyl ester carboxylesterase